ncbi:MAG TPA: WXG100 family type VII secretion target [Jatrophihabitantaceae bacterium]
MHHTQGRTDFSQYSHAQLIAMLAASDPATIRAAAANWDSTGRLLHDQAETLQQQLSGFDDKWQGQAAQQYHRMITDLATGLRTVADTAWGVRDAAYDAADALDTARAEMPAPQAVPEVAPATVALATTPPQFDGLSPAQASQLVQQQTAAATVVRQQQQAQATADAAHAQAVQVMTKLADHYATDDAAIPEVPDAGTAPTVDPNVTDDAIGTPTAVGVPTTLGPGVILDCADPAGGEGGAGAIAPGTEPSGGSHGLVGASGLPGGAPPAATTPNPLFGNMFREGIAAAGATFPISRIPSLIRRRDRANDPKRTAGGAPAAATAAGAAAAGSKLSGALPGGGGGAGIGGIGGGPGGGGGGLSAGDTPAAYAGLAGSSSAPGAGAAAAGLAGAVGGAGSTNSAGGFMGGMPMGGAGMGGMGMDGGGRRIPPWLVETEDVWGESSAVSPTVIGEEL